MCNAKAADARMTSDSILATSDFPPANGTAAPEDVNLVSKEPVNTLHANGYGQMPATKTHLPVKVISAELLDDLEPVAVAASVPARVYGSPQTPSTLTPSPPPATLGPAIALPKLPVSPALSTESFQSAVSNGGLLDAGTPAGASAPSVQGAPSITSAAPLPATVTSASRRAVNDVEPTPERMAKSVRSARQLCLQAEYVAAWEAEQRFTRQEYECMASVRAAVDKAGKLEEWIDNKPMWYRFCQARGWDVDKAVKMVCDHLDWRKTHGLHEFIDTPTGPTPRFLLEFVYPELGPVKAAYNFTHHKCDKEGRPVYFDRLGDMNYAQMMQAKGSTAERVLLYFTWYAEATWHYRLPAASLACGKYVGKGLYVMDLKGFALSKHFTYDTREFIKSFIGVASANYPETIYKTYMINAPFIFRTAWAFISKFLDERQVAKFSIMGGPKEYLPKLLEVMDIENIPTQFGGKDTTCTFYEERGPWASKETFGWPSPAGPRVE